MMMPVLCQSVGAVERMTQVRLLPTLGPPDPALRHMGTHHVRVAKWPVVLAAEHAEPEVLQERVPAVTSRQHLSPSHLGDGGGLARHNLSGFAARCSRGHVFHGDVEDEHRLGVGGGIGQRNTGDPRTPVLAVGGLEELGLDIHVVLRVPYFLDATNPRVVHGPAVAVHLVILLAGIPHVFWEIGLATAESTTEGGEVKEPGG